MRRAIDNVLLLAATMYVGWVIAWMLFALVLQALRKNRSETSTDKTTVDGKEYR